MEGQHTDASRNARLFIALWPDPDVRDAIAAWSERWQWPAAAKRVRAENLHLTLHFLADVPREKLPELRPALALPFAPFTLVLERAALWRGGTAVLEPDRVPLRLHELHAALGDALQHLAIPVETRALRPHVTLARRAGSAQPPASVAQLRWRVKGYALARSRPGMGYEVLQAYR
jgi:2'-5' RNA ligase